MPCKAVLLHMRPPGVSRPVALDVFSRVDFLQEMSFLPVKSYAVCQQPRCFVRTQVT